MDLDQGGFTYQKVRVWMGPSLGWVDQQVKPNFNIVIAGTFNLPAGTSIVLINVAGLVTVNLPSVAAWLKEPACNPMTAFERALWIKDLGGNAQAFNITVAPFGTDKIDNLGISFTIVQNRQLLRLYPLNDLSGWMSG